MIDKIAAIYIRRSDKDEDDADISDDVQLAVCRSRLPAGLRYEVFNDSGGDRRRNSGYTPNRGEYQRMLAWLRDGRLAMVVAYNSSRFNRNTESSLSLYREAMDHGVLIVTGAIDPEQLKTGDGKFMFTVNAAVDEKRRNDDSKNALDRARRLFEKAEPHGADPYGYRTRKAWSATKQAMVVVRPRTWEVVGDEADIVRRIFAMLTTRSTSDIAAALNAEGVRRRNRRLWTRDSVKDIARRRLVYLGNVTRGRDGDVESVAGRHEPIITDDMDRASTAGQRQRFHAGRRPKKHRTYPLIGLVHHECGFRLHGQTRVARGHEWRYYVCRRCGVSVGGVEAERVVFDAIGTMRLPEKAIDRARDVLADRLKVPRGGLVDRQRQALLTRLANLRKQHEWGDITDDEYFAAKRQVAAMLAEVPAIDKLVLFDQHRRVLTTMVANVEAASPPLRAELARRLIRRIVARGRKVSVQDIEWAGPVKPFFLPLEAPPDGFEPPTQALGRPRSIH